MTEITFNPYPQGLDAETYEIRMARALRGFTTRKDAVLRLEMAGYTQHEIMAFSGRAIHREVLRQMSCNERPRLVTEENRVPGGDPWLAYARDYRPGDPVGTGATQFRAIMDWVKKLEGE